MNDSLPPPAPCNTGTPSPEPPPRSHHAGDRYQLDHVADEALHVGVKTLVGRHNVLTADLLAHLAEVDARGIYRERACSSLYAYCIYELRFSEDEAQRRVQAARAARRFPILFEMLADGSIHLTGLLLLAPHLTPDGHAELLARARFRTKREIERLVAEVAPRPDVAACVEPLGPRPTTATNLWQAYTASLRGAVRELSAGVGRGEAPPAWFDESAVPEVVNAADGPSRADGTPTSGAGAEPSERPKGATESLVPLRYRVEFSASQEYVDRLEEARNLLQYQVRSRDIAQVHELAMACFVEHLRKRRQAATQPSRGVASEEPAPARVKSASEGPAPARIKSASEGPAPARVTSASEGPAPARIKSVSEGPAPARIKAASGGRAAERPRRDSAVHGRHIPAEVRRAIWQRDLGRCTFTGSSGQRCRECAGLEIHHEHAFALGGESSLANLKLLCRAHNALLAERDFGRERMVRKRSARVDRTA